MAAADIDEDNLKAFREQWQIPSGYADYQEMLTKERLDIVSVCVWPALHAPLVIDAARSGVKAIHAEKPMAPTWGECRRMAAECESRRVQLTFNHQRRFGAPFRGAKKLLDEDAIGELLRLEAFTINLFDWGTHWFDLMFMYNDEVLAEWVIGQIDARGGSEIFGVMVEGQAVSYLKWRNGVSGLLVTGQGAFGPREGKLRDMSCGNRLVGSGGTIEVGVKDGPDLRYRNADTGGRWREVEGVAGLHGEEHVSAGIRDLVDCIGTEREPVLSARKALRATELIFATYESSRRRGRVDLPLEIEDSPFQAMLDSGALGG